MNKMNEFKSQELQEKKIEKQGSIDSSKKCGNCGSTVQLLADICEKCGEWLLKGKCIFCYNEVAIGQKFCSECGNTPEGITCSRCGKISFFDFCKNCNIPLTDQALEMIENIKALPELQKLIEKEDCKTNLEQIELSKIKDYSTKCEKNHKVKKFEIKNCKDISGQVTKYKDMLASEEKRKIDENKAIEESKKQDEEINKILEQIQQKSFANNQEARRFYGALKVFLPVIEKKTYKKLLGWKCNAYNCLHYDGPTGCAMPGLGGHWEYADDIINSVEIKETEI